MVAYLMRRFAEHYAKAAESWEIVGSAAIWTISRQPPTARNTAC
jgi:hypothetical protein